jgi:hypothetical protein
MKLLLVLTAITPFWLIGSRARSSYADRPTGLVYLEQCARTLIAPSYPIKNKYTKASSYVI